MLAPTEPAPHQPSSPLPLPSALLAAELGPAVMADDPCEAAYGSADPTGPRNYYRARYYDPKIGRFISEDPIGFLGGSNFYAYVENNPVRYVDPHGLESMTYPIGNGTVYNLSDKTTYPTPPITWADPAAQAGAAAIITAPIWGPPAAAAAGAVCAAANPKCLAQLAADLATCSQTVGHAGITWNLCWYYARSRYNMCRFGVPFGI